MQRQKYYITTPVISDFQEIQARIIRGGYQVLGRLPGIHVIIVNLTDDEKSYIGENIVKLFNGSIYPYTTKGVTQWPKNMISGR